MTSKQNFLNNSSLNNVNQGIPENPTSTSSLGISNSSSNSQPNNPTRTPIRQKRKNLWIIILICLLAIILIAYLFFFIQPIITDVINNQEQPVITNGNQEISIADEEQRLKYRFEILDSTHETMLRGVWRGISLRRTKVTSVPSNFPIYIDSNISSFKVVLAYQGLPSSLNSVLHSPDNEEASAISCDIEGMYSLCFFQAKAIEGIWNLKLEATGHDIKSEYRVYGYHQSGMTPIRAFASCINCLKDNIVEYPEPIGLLAFVNREWPITGLVVTATIEDPDGEILAFAMLDDGVGPDALADDGLYSAILDYTKEGTYNITVQFSNPDGTALMTRKSMVFTNPQHGWIGSYLEPIILAENSSHFTLTQTGSVDGTIHLASDSFVAAKPPDGWVESYPKTIPLEENFERFARTQISTTGVRKDDHGDTPLEATLLPTDNRYIAGKIDYEGDLDYFKINVPIEADEIIVRITSLALGMEPRLRIIAQDMKTVIADFTNPDDDFLRYIYMPLADFSGETIYCEVTDVNGNSRGTYRISAGEKLGHEKIPIPSVTKSE